MQSRNCIRLSVLALTIALFGAASGIYAQNASPPSGADQDHSAHHPPPAGEAPAVSPTTRNASNDPIVSAHASRVAVQALPTDEELTIARHVREMLTAQPKSVHEAQR